MPFYRPILLAALVATTACGETQLAQRQAFKERAATPVTQPAQAPIGDFNGKWVGTGRNALAAFRSRCGGGPLVHLNIRDGAARGVFTFTIRKGMERDIQSDVLPLTGTIDGHGRLQLSDFQSDVIGVLSARDGTGDGSWESRGLACHGTFRVQRRP